MGVASEFLSEMVVSERSATRIFSRSDWSWVIELGVGLDSILEGVSGI